MNKITIPRIIVILAAVCAIAAFFLPYISATDEYRTYLNSRASERPFDSVDITVGQMADMSLFMYAKTYFQGGEEFFRSQGDGIFYGVLLSSIACFGLLILLAALGKKPILILIFDILMAVAFYAVNWDFVDRRIMPDSNRIWGISHGLYYPIAVIIAIAAIWMFVAKRQMKKTAV